MISNFFRSIVLAGVLVSVGIAALSGTAIARTNYDGNWSVLITTHSGACDRAHRYGVQITNGQIFSGGGVQGRVNQNGAVRVNVSSGSRQANGSGRLSRDHGSGMWRGQGPNGACAGTWEADRRG